MERMTAHPFVFERYAFDADAAVLHLHYRYDGGARFEEKISFPAPTQPLSTDRSAALDRAFRLIFLLAGVSYYKAYVPQDLICEAFPLDRATADFVARVYLHGLGEFSYCNRIDLSDKIRFAISDAPALTPLSLDLPQRVLVPVGGGKDSIISLELLKQAGYPVTLYAQGKSATDIAAPIEATIEASGLPALIVGRVLSDTLLELNRAGALNGHVPITAILSSITIACALLYGFDTIALSNEHSASTPNLKIGDVEVNHQYSKSLNFEHDLSVYVATCLSPNIRYFSLLRPLTETAIARRFAKLKKYHGVFRSCNTAFRQDKKQRAKNWCCECPKCRFVFLALAPFMDKPSLIDIFGKNLLDDEKQNRGFSELCGLTAHKPFECVGDIEESALLMEKLQQSATWKNDCIVRDLGAQIVSQQDFDMRYNALFTLCRDHRVPEEFLRLLNAHD
ncbi:MAG: endonuclease domain-containing protein [Desulfobulbaceae bacterium]|nr:endonuclease domain-containing protein [Desulfobulbaceae bacterium]